MMEKPIILSCRQAPEYLEFFANGTLILTLDRLPEAPHSPVKAYPKLDPDIYPNAVAKVCRANELLEQIDAALDGYFGQRPISLTVRHEGSDVVFGMSMTDQVPISIATIASDHLSNLRAALNLLICDLVRLRGGTPTKANQFPACQNLKKYMKERSARLEGVSPEAKKFVDRLRPYQGGIELFFELASVRNTSEHNFIVPVVLGSLRMQVKASLPGIYVAPDGRMSVGHGFEGSQPVGYSAGLMKPRGAVEVKCVPNFTVEMFRAPKEVLNLQMVVEPQVSILLGEEVGSLSFLGRCQYMVSKVIKTAQNLELK